MKNKLLLLTFMSVITLAFSSCEKENDPVENMTIYTGFFEYNEDGFNDDGIHYFRLEEFKYCGRYTSSTTPIIPQDYVYFQKEQIPEELRNDNKIFNVEIQYELLHYDFSMMVYGIKLYYISEIK